MEEKRSLAADSEKSGQEVGEAREGMIASQAAKTIEKGRHYDVEQKTKARKGHLLVDRLGLIPSLSVQKLRTDQIQMVPNGCRQK